ncbi:MAG: NAD-dependent epimerase/dehydratase family protein [Trebonia sp.]
MKIAVTGASGRLGRAVLELALAEGHQVTAIDRSSVVPVDRNNARSRTVDLTDYPRFLDAVADADAVIHLAAYTSPAAAPEPVVHNNNVVASYNALAVAEAAGITRICLASSINAIGGVYSRQPRYDYFPLDEAHPGYAEDGYSMSKWAAEQQAAAFARRLPGLSVACLRLHALRDREDLASRLRDRPDAGSKDLWGCTPMTAAARACLNAVTRNLGGCEVFYVVASDTWRPEPSAELRDRYYPDVPVRGDLSGHKSFFDSSKAEKLLQCRL